MTNRSEDAFDTECLNARILRENVAENFGRVHRYFVEAKPPSVWYRQVSDC